MIVQGSTITPSGRNLYGSGSKAVAGQAASYRTADGEIASATVLDARRTPAGCWMGPDVIVLAASSPEPAVGAAIQLSAPAALAAA